MYDNFSVNTPESLSYFITQSQKIIPEKFNKKIKVAFLSSFTINGLAESLKVKCSYRDIGCQTFVGGYNQYNQEILNPDSELKKFNPDLTFLLIDIRSFFGDFFYNPYNMSIKKRKNFVETKLNELISLVNTFEKNYNSTLIISNLNNISFSIYGIADQKTDFSLNDMVNHFNNLLKIKYKNNDSVLIYDFSNFVVKYGENNVFNYQNYFFGDIKVSLDFLPRLADDLLPFLIAVTGKSKKCIVLDLDNTLWGGIVGEDGFDGIHLGPQPPGNTFYEFQKYLKALSQRGILLAINSKNNSSDALQVISEHPYMVLRKEDFSSIRINWNDKVTNMKEIANELNIGIESLLFFDDDPVNRQLIRDTFPLITTPELPSDPSYYPKILQELPDFSLLKITDEDRNRKQMYKDQENRKILENQSNNIDDFLKSLNLKIVIKNASSFTIPRISQLTMKTNQFNLTTKRYQENEIKNFSHNEQMLVGCAQVSDKFGDNGITGVFIVSKKINEWYIDTFLLSCRVIGREIEKAMLNYIINEAKKAGVSRIIAKYIPTEKNKPIEDFLPRCGFAKENDFWVFDVSKPLKMPPFLDIQVES